MASFSTKLQIPCILWSQSKQSSKLSEHILRNLVNLVRSSDPRSFWSWARRSSDKRDKSKEDRRAPTCGKSPLDRPQPSNPECVSKCVQINSCRDNELAKRRLTNCRDLEIITEQKSYWEMIFGSKWKGNKLPRNCGVPDRALIISRQQDPRLNDPRYETTAGDVLIFTECPRARVCESDEPRPVQPPSYKLPRPVFTQQFVKQAGIIPHACAAAWQLEANCDDNSPRCSGPKASTMPFEELRPPEKQRKMYFCKIGVRPEDVSGPLMRNPCSCATSRSETRREQPTDLTGKNNCTELPLDISSTRGKSRIEQLKKLTRAREGSSCCELFVKNTLNTPACCPRSCKMSTLARYCVPLCKM